MNATPADRAFTREIISLMKLRAFERDLEAGQELRRLWYAENPAFRRAARCSRAVESQMLARMDAELHAARKRAAWHAANPFPTPQEIF